MESKQEKAPGAGTSPQASAAVIPSALVCHGHSRPIVEISYSPITPDGYFLISASKDGRPMLRNGETGDWIGTFEGHKGAVWSATLDTPALRAATASADFTAKVWDALTGNEMHSFEHKHIVRTADFSQSTQLLLTGGAEKTLRVFDLGKPEAGPTAIPGLPGTIRCAKWHENDTLALVTCSDIKGIKVVDMRAGGEAVAEIPTSAPCTSLDFSAGGNTITLADGASVTFWDRKGSKVLASFPLPKQAISASLSPTAPVFAAGGDDMWVRVFSSESGDEIACHKGHHGPVHCVRFAPDGQSCASGSEDGTIRIWRVGAGGATMPAGNGEAPTIREDINGAEGKEAAAGVTHVSAADGIAERVEGFHISS